MKNGEYLPDGTIVAFSSRFNWKEWASWKHSFFKPFHYGIQRMTGSHYHHLAIMCDSSLYEAMGTCGVRKLTLGERIKETDVVVDLYALEPIKPFTKEQSSVLKKDLEAQLGKKFNGVQALWAFLFFPRFRNKTMSKTMFCSKLVFKAWLKVYPDAIGRILPRSINPERCHKLLAEKGLIKTKYLIGKSLYI